MVSKGANRQVESEGSAYQTREPMGRNRRGDGERAGSPAEEGTPEGADVSLMLRNAVLDELAWPSH
jgi:hypothetical protein